MNLRFKIAQNLPRDSVALRALLSIASIEETETTPTACVTLGQNPRLLINPRFVDQHANTPTKLQTLIGHELLHVALGHTRRYTTCTPLDNLVFDCLINATLAKADPTPERTALFRDFYTQDKFPECFLRPPDVWHPSSRVRLPKALKSPRAEGLLYVQDVYRRLWSDVGVSGSEIRAALLRGAESLNRPIDIAIEQIPLLGVHEDEGVGDMTQPMSALTEHFADLLGKEIADKHVKRGVHPNESFPLRQNLKAAVSTNPLIKKRLRRLFECLAHGTGSARLRSQNVSGLTYVTPIPCKDRRAIVQRLLGNQPMLYTATTTELAIRASQRIHVYLDVSGSMDSVLPALYGAMHDCRKLIHHKLHLFSTEVADVTLAQLKSGLRITTMGTDINCVAKHIEQHKIRRALIVTDGLVGETSQDAERILRQTDFAIGLTGPYTATPELAELGIRCTRLV